MTGEPAPESADATMLLRLRVVAPAGAGALVATWKALGEPKPMTRSVPASMASASGRTWSEVSVDPLEMPAVRAVGLADQAMAEPGPKGPLGASVSSLTVWSPRATSP